MIMKTMWAYPKAIMFCGYVIGRVAKVKDLREKLFTHCAAVTEKLFTFRISVTYQSRTIAIPSLLYNITQQHLFRSFRGRGSGRTI